MEAHVCGITEISDKQLESTCDEFAADTQLMEKLIAVSDTLYTAIVSGFTHDSVSLTAINFSISWVSAANSSQVDSNS